MSSVYKALATIRENIISYRDGISRDASVASVVLPDNFAINNSSIKQILNLYLDGQIGEWEVEYMAVSIELSDLELNELEEEVLFNLSSPELGYGVSNVNASTAKRLLETGDTLQEEWEDIGDRVMYRILL